ncbi:DUF2560 family protein [Cronobacter sakazakii]|nr:DUF2560 family protein [Cronobacter sakazakii]ELQ6154274.1 DUF2560 family protein [Cronobacter sakazakii]ELQ6163235.1 DUF2560 family protein [Cronobacter sakazakii]
MAEVTQMTDTQLLNLDLYRLVMKDTAAAKKAIAFVAGNQLKAELFKDAYTLATAESGVVGRTDKAIQTATEALALFEGAQ